MGLGISSKNYRYSYSYSALHQIRGLSLIYCGCPEEIQGKYCSFLLTYPYFEKVLPPDDMSVLFESVMRAGYLFPELNLHSDCDGKYTSRGKINLSTYETGNSKRLLKELNLLKESTKIQNFIKGKSIQDIFNDFYNVVSDCVAEKQAIIFS